MTSASKWYIRLPGEMYANNLNLDEPMTESEIRETRDIDEDAELWPNDGIVEEMSRNGSRDYADLMWM